MAFVMRYATANRLAIANTASKLGSSGVAVGVGAGAPVPASILSISLYQNQDSHSRQSREVVLFQRHPRDKLPLPLPCTGLFISDRYNK